MWYFLQLAFLIYFMIFVMRSLGTHLFDNYFYKQVCDWADNCCNQWVRTHHQDEWIRGTLDEKHYNERVDGWDSNEFLEAKLDEDSDDDLEGLLVGDVSSLTDMTRLKGIARFLWNENCGTFSIISRFILSLTFMKLMYSWGFASEMVTGLILGALMHMGDMLIQLYHYMTQWYFDQTCRVDIPQKIMRSNKFAPLTIMITPAVTIFLLNLVKANSYSRVIGEWIIDMSMVMLYMCHIVGYMFIQTLIQLVYESKNRPSLLFLAAVYCLMGIFI